MEDKTIVRYLLDNNELDLKQIVEDYSNYIYTIIRNMTNNLLKEEDTEELISDVLFAVWKNKERIEKDLELKPYIAGITKNIVKNKLRSVNSTYKIEETIDDDVKDTSNLEEIFCRKEQMKEVNKELDKMKKKDKEIFISFYCYGKKSKEIAEELNSTESNINTKLHRIKKKLKKALDKRGDSYEE